MNAQELPRLWDHIVNHQWPEATARAVTHPEEIGIRHNGRTALHLACVEGAAPPGVIRSLVEASPAATEGRCFKGCTPLHWACVFSRADYVSILLEANGRTATMTDHHGYEPIHMVLHPFVLSSSPWGVRNEEVSDRRDRAWRIIHTLVEHRVLREISGTTTSRFGGGGNFLHACAGIAQCPPSVLQIFFHFIDSRRFGIKARARDADGRLPLHVAASNANLSGERAAGIVATLLEAHPAAAREVDARSGGRLPLHAAIAAGKGWAEGVKYIVHAYPPAVTVRDPATGLFPFMMAASAIEHGPPFSAEATAYELLRWCPELERVSRPGGEEESVRDESGGGGNGRP